MMKRIVSMLLALMMTLSFVPNTVQAEQTEEIYIEDSTSMFDLVDSGAVTVIEPEQSVLADSTEDTTLTNPQESAVVQDIQDLLHQNMTVSNSGTTVETSDDAVLTTRAINHYYWYANATGDLSGNGSTAWSRTAEKSFTGTDIDIVWISPASNLSSSATVAYVDVYKVSVNDGDELQILVDGDAFKSQCPNLTQVVIRGVTDDDMFNVNAGSLLLDGTADVELVIEGSPSYVAANPGNQPVYMDVGAVSLECNYVTFRNAPEAAINCMATAVEQISLSNCTFEETVTRMVGNGGAIYVGASSVIDTFEISNCTFNKNKCSHFGGAIYLGGAIEQFRLTGNNLFNGCEAERSGGAITICNHVGSVSIQGTFQNCVAAQDGGAIFVADDIVAQSSRILRNIGDLAITNSTFTGNSAQGKNGGAIFLGSIINEADIENTTFTGCEAAESGGAIFMGAAVGRADIQAAFTGCIAYRNGGAISFETIDWTNAAQTGKCYNRMHTVTVYGSSFDTCKVTAEKDGVKASQGDSTGNGGAVYFGAQIHTINIYGCSFNKCESSGWYTNETGSAITFGYANVGKDTTHTNNKIEPDKSWTDPVTWTEEGQTKGADARAEYYNWDLKENGMATYWAKTTIGTVNIGSLTIGEEIIHTTITDCESNYQGGGLMFRTGCYIDDLNVSKLTIEGCKAPDRGSAIFFNNCVIAQADFENCTIKDCILERVKAANKYGGTMTTVGQTTMRLNVTNCLFEGNVSYDSGGGLYWNSGYVRNTAITSANDVGEQIAPVANVSGCTFRNNEATGLNGGGVFTQAKMIITNCLFEGNKAIIGGGIYMDVYSNTYRMMQDNEVTQLKLDKHTVIRYNQATDGGGIGICANSTVSLRDDEEYAHTVDFTLGGAQIYDNVATGNGGGIFYKAYYYPDDPDGSDEVKRYTKTITINDGTVYGNSAGGNGGGIYMESSNNTTIMVSDGTIYNNQAGLSRTVTVSSEDVTGEDGTVSKAYHYDLSAGEQTGGNGGGIYLTGTNALVSVTGGIIGATEVETTNDEGETVLTLVAAPNMAKAVRDSESDAWIGGNGGGIAIFGGARIQMTKGVSEGTICYNQADIAGGGIAVHDASSMAISGGLVTNNQASYGGGISVDGSIGNPSGEVESERWGMYIDGGTISNNMVTKGNVGKAYGGGVCLNNGSTLRIDGGLVAHNKASDEDGEHFSENQEGGGIAVCNESSVAFYGGIIEQNDAYDGGGIAISGGSSFIMHPVITEENGEEVVTFGLVDQNTADHCGGGIYLFNSNGKSNTLTINDGTISNNISTTGDGGGMYSAGSTVSIFGGTIYKNDTSMGNGGGLCAVSASNITVSGGSIYKNKACGNGGGIYAGDSAAVVVRKDAEKLTYGIIRENQACNGGGVFVTNGATLTVDEGQITFNKAVGTTSSITTGYREYSNLVGTGGGICVANNSDSDLRATFTLTGSTTDMTNMAIYGNLADFAADDVFANGVNTTLSVPQVSSMNLSGYSFKPEGWFEDYCSNDTKYTSGLNLGGSKDITDGHVYRYRGAFFAYRIMISEVKVTEKVNADDTYVAMTLGIPAAVDDTVVVDYHLEVNINLQANDLMITEEEFADSAKLGLIMPDVSYKDGVYYGNLDEVGFVGTVLTHGDEGLKFGDATLSGHILKYRMTTMNMPQEDTFYYTVGHDGPDEDSEYDFYYYAKVTVIPATTLYFEDNCGFVSYTGAWSTVDNSADTDPDEDTDLSQYQQNQDRPGGAMIPEIDADKVYGYDDAFNDVTTYSMGSAHKAKVSSDMSATATFTFTGTGFDIISLSNPQTGMVMVSIYEGTEIIPDDKATEDVDESNIYETLMVDTYYKTDSSLYQVPIIKRTGLDYGTWTVEIYVAWAWWADHGQYDYGSWDFYLDAIRIYDPADDGVHVSTDADGNTVYNTTIQDAYLADNECWPTYQELRNMFISQANLTDDPQNGIIFIDGKVLGTNTDGTVIITDAQVEEYKNFGPNNEVYLDVGQSIAFTLNELNYADQAFSSEAFTDTEVAAIHIGMRSLVGGGNVTITPATGTATSCTLSATDRYYDITSMKNQVVTITNSGENAVSITTVKVTHTGNPGTQGNMMHLFTVNHGTAKAALALISNESAEPQVPILTPKYPTLSFEGEIKYNVYFSAENLGSLTVADLGLVTFTTEDLAGTVDTATDVITGAEVSGALYVVSTDGIAAKNLGDTLYFKVFAKLADGSYVYSDLYSYSAAQYATNVLADETASNVSKTLVVAMLNYGAEAQKFFGHNVESLMNKDLTAEQRALVAGYSAANLKDVGTVDETKVGNFVSNGGFTRKHPTVSFEGAFSINYYFVPEKTVDGHMTFYYWTEDTYSRVSQLTAENADGSRVMPLVGSTYTAVSPEIVAKALDQTIYVAAVYESEGVTYCTGILSYSLAAYCQEHASNAASGMTAFANAAAIYGCAAKEFFDI